VVVMLEVLFDLFFATHQVHGQDGDKDGYREGHGHGADRPGIHDGGCRSRGFMIVSSLETMAPAVGFSDRCVHHTIRGVVADFETTRLPTHPDVIAPDGSDVRVLARTHRGGMAHFELAPGRASDAIRHRTVDEIWFVLSGSGEMWRSQDEREEVVSLEP